MNHVSVVAIHRPWHPSRLTFCALRRLSSTAAREDNQTQSRKVFPGVIEKSVNRVELLGRVGAAPQIRGSAHAVVSFSLATNHPFRDTDTGETRVKSDWHHVAVFIPAVKDHVMREVTKGKRVYVSGRITYDVFEGGDGAIREASSIVADDMSEYRPVKRVIFDMDGLLLDTEELYSKAYQNVLDKDGSGQTYTFEFKARNILGRKPVETSKTMVEHYGLSMTPEEFLEALEKEYELLFPHTTWMPGVLKLLHHLYKNKIPMAVATSSGVKQFERKAASHRRLFGFFSHVVKGADVERGKPAPDIYLRAARLFDEGGEVAPQDCLAFEDAPSGVASASAAGMQVVMIPDERMPEDLLKEATLVVRGTAHSFRPELFGLPPLSYSPVKCVLFDVDGLMLDTTRIYDEVNRIVVEGQGKKFDPEFHRTLKGMRWPENARKIIQHYGLPDEIPGVFAGSDELLARLLKDSVMLPGVERLVRHLKARGIPIAVATSGASGNFEIKTARHREIFDLFDQTVCGGTDPAVKSGKPSPDVFLVAARRLSVDPSDCLVLEDAANGAVAAAAAGMQCVLVPERGEWANPDETLAATQLLATLQDFRPEDFGLPAFS